MSDNYVQYICVTIKSIIENHKDTDVTIHVLSDVLSDESIRRLNSTIDKDSNHIHLQIHYVNDTPLKGLPLKRFTKYAWYRILMPDILDEKIEYVLYLDADTLVVANLQNLFACLKDKEQFSLKGVIDCTQYLIEYQEARKETTPINYINSGVLLFNMKYWRS